jgi:hypothetical protein
LVLVTHSRDSLNGGLASEVSVPVVPEGSGCIEAETEESVLVLEIKLGIVLETEETVLQRKKNDDGLGRRTIKGNVFKNSDISLFFFAENERERDELMIILSFFL